MDRLYPRARYRPARHGERADHQEQARTSQTLGVEVVRPPATTYKTGPGPLLVSGRFCFAGSSQAI